MAKEIQFSRISTKLQNLKSAHPQDVSAKLWRETFKGLINGGEAMRLFDVFAGELMLLEARNKVYLTWSKKANSANWTAKWLEHLFDKYNIISHFGPAVDANGKMLHAKKQRVVTEVQPVVTPKVLSAPDISGLETLSDEALDALIEMVLQEKDRREEERRRAEEEARIRAKRLQMLKTVIEMLEGEGESMDNLMKSKL